MINNSLEATLSDQVMQHLLTTFELIVDELPFMLSLTPEERQGLQSIGDGRWPYVLKCLEYCKAHHKKIGMSLEDLAELESTALLFSQLAELLRRADDLRVGLRDTVMMVGANYYRLCRAAHDQMEIAYGKGRPGMERMLKDMDKLFENQGNFKPATEEDKSGDTLPIPGNQQTNAPGDGGKPA